MKVKYIFFSFTGNQPLFCYDLLKTVTFEVIFVGTDFIFSIISSHVITESPMMHAMYKILVLAHRW